MTQPTWIGTRRIVNGAVVTEVVAVPCEREVAIVVTNERLSLTGTRGSD